MSHDRSTSPVSIPSTAHHQRRASLASGLPFPDYNSRLGNQGGNGGSQAGSMSNSAANQRRRLSITTLGLSGSPTQTSSFGAKNFHRGSVSSSAGSGPPTEDAVEDTDNTSPKNSPFARRMSFGAQALRDVRSGSMNNGEGFSWSEALRSRAERAPSFGGTSPNAPQSQNGFGTIQQQGYHQRAASIASMEQPTREMPKNPKQNKPDFFQEKILRGDFMD